MTKKLLLKKKALQKRKLRRSLSSKKENPEGFTQEEQGIIDKIPPYRYQIDLSSRVKDPANEYEIEFISFKNKKTECKRSLMTTNYPPEGWQIKLLEDLLNSLKNK